MNPFNLNKLLFYYSEHFIYSFRDDESKTGFLHQNSILLILLSLLFTLPACRTIDTENDDGKEKKM
jgi:hypothetical protein